MKIDRSLVVAMPRGSKHISIVRAILALADALDLQTTAEGVDDAEQAVLLREMGCNHGQGYYWSHPLPAAQAEELIARQLDRPDRRAAHDGHD